MTAPRPSLATVGAKPQPGFSPRGGKPTRRDGSILDAVPHEFRLILAGAGGIVFLIAFAIVVRPPIDADAMAMAFDGATASAAPSANAPDSASATPAESAAPTGAATGVTEVVSNLHPPAGSARVLHSDMPVVNTSELRAKLEKDLQVGNYPASVADIDALVRRDPTVADDHDMRERIVDLAMRIMVGGGTPAEELFDMITQRMSSHGCDILYELVTTRGGSRAAKRADELLKNPDVIARGTPAMRVAWELRTVGCDKKAELFDRAKADGDGRAFGQLVLLGQDCRRRGGPCCMHDDPRLKDAVASMKARLNLQ